MNNESLMVSPRRAELRGSAQMLRILAIASRSRVTWLDQCSDLRSFHQASDSGEALSRPLLVDAACRDRLVLIPDVTIRSAPWWAGQRTSVGTTIPRMSAYFWARKITTNSNATIVLEPGAVLLVVGPNNGGKSTFLRELDSHVTHTNNGLFHLIKEVEFEQSGTVQEFEAWLEEHLARTEGVDGAVWFSGVNPGVERRQLVGDWEGRGRGEGMRLLGSSICHLASAGSRILDSDAAQQVDLVRHPASHPLHVAYKDSTVEDRLCRDFRDAFGVGLVVYRMGGTHIHLMVGEPPALEPGEDRLSLRYQRAVTMLPWLNEQGDGMKSFAAALLAFVLDTRKLVLIDEPEAFLHPPQARSLGRRIAGSANQERQVFAATHSGDVLRGVLDVAPQRLHIVRLARTIGREVRVTQLDVNQVRQLWSDPSLRFSNVLDAIFHERVVICEGDTDCRFYAAMTDAISASDGRALDLMFTSVGGKHKVPIIARALHRMGVPVTIVVDFDVLDDAAILERLYTSLDGDWSLIAKKHKELSDGINRLRVPPLAVAELRANLTTALERMTGPYLSNDDRDAVRATVRDRDPWKGIKDGGLASIGDVQLRETARWLIEALRHVGLHVVPSGQLESLVPAAGSKSRSWLERALGYDLLASPELNEARCFVRSILAT